MKHLLLAQILALLLHGALFMVQFGGFPLQQARPLPREISVELVAPPQETRQVGAEAAATPAGEPQVHPAVRRPEKQQPRPRPTARQKEPPAMASAPVETAAPPAAENTPPVAPAQPVATNAEAAPAAQLVAAAAGPPAAGTGAIASQQAADILAAFPAPAAGGNRGTKQEMGGPLYRVNPPPDYPPLARKRGLEGTVELDVLVGPDGTADTVRLALTSGHDLLDRAALSAVEKWQFTPGKKGEEAAAMWVRVPVRFALHK